ncbi:hypothetical protein EDF68_10894 [Ochrobactrum sp. BH3]|nr:hypothetical protein EDF68_10894 [Ochrobactrum sp. BH3]
MFAALEERGWSEFYGNSQPKCPHCGDDYDIREYEAWFLYSDDERHEVDCPSCGEPFSVNSTATWSFSTDEQED